MKKILVILFMVSSFFACENEDLDPRPDLNDNVGAVTIVSNQSIGAFDLTLIDTEVLSFDVDVDGFEITDVTSVSVQLVYTDVLRLPNPDPTGDDLDSVYAPIEIATVTTFPSTVTITPADIVAAIPDFASTADFNVGDNANFIFPITTADGRVLTTALESDLCQQPAQPSFGGCNVSMNMICSFVEADALGSYLMTTDGFGGANLDPGATIELVAGTAPNTYVFQDMFKHTPAFDVEIVVDPATGAVTVARQDAFDTGVVTTSDFGVATVEGSGSFFSCIGQVNLDLTVRVAVGSFGTDLYVLQKQ